MVEQEAAAANPFGIGRTSDDEDVVGANDDQIMRDCRGKAPTKVTRTGCSGQSTIWVNADRPPEAIAATIIHERQHLRFRGPVQHDEDCAKYVAALFGANMLPSNKAAASADPYFYTSWRRPGGKCF